MQAQNYIIHDHAAPRKPFQSDESAKENLSIVCSRCIPFHADRSPAICFPQLV
jgi:hypothetical protein